MSGGSGIWAACRTTAMAMALAALPHAALAEPVIRVSVEEYAVEGSTGAELMDAIRRKGPRHGIISRAMAQTRYSLDYDFEAVRRGDRCRIVKVEVRLDMVYFYPTLARPVSPALQRRWQIFLRDVRRHEQGHGALAKRLARDTEKALLALSAPGGDTSCERVRQKVPGVVLRVFRAYENLQVRYDETEHRKGGPVDRMVQRLVAGEG